MSHELREKSASLPPTSTAAPSTPLTETPQLAKSSLDGPSASGPGRPTTTSKNDPPSLKCDETHSTTSALSPSAIASVDSTCVAARCRPVKSYRRRKLLQMSGLHHVSRKAARPVTLSCSCWPPSATHRGGHDYR